MFYVLIVLCTLRENLSRQGLGGLDRTACISKTIKCRNMRERKRVQFA